jgi:type II secretory pathway component GspD/PulD (secretin)
MSPLAKLLLAIAFFPTFTGISPAAEQPKKTETRPTGIFQVNVTGDHLSLNADDAPVAQIFREIAVQTGITIDSNIGPEEKITARLDRVPLEDGIRQIAKNVSVIYAQDAKTNTRRIAKVVVLSEAKGPAGQTKTSPQPERVNAPAAKPAKGDKPQQPEPFKFQFDPTKSAEKKSREKQP